MCVRSMQQIMQCQMILRGALEGKKSRSVVDQFELLQRYLFGSSEKILDKSRQVRRPAGTELNPRR